MAQDGMKITIGIMENGPLRVSGLRTLRNSKSEEIQVKEQFSLCRCGSSANKPFCDGTHRSIGFSGAREIAKPLHREKAYTGANITVYDNRVICSHAKECVHNLSPVFDSEARPWINSDAADMEQLIATVKKCPSGALSYAIGDVHYRDSKRDPAIDICKDGPYNITGGIKLQVEEAMQPPSREHYSLCRCGASKNKPYCDGSHSEIDFKDED